MDYSTKNTCSRWRRPYSCSSFIAIDRRIRTAASCTDGRLLYSWIPRGARRISRPLVTPMERATLGEAIHTRAAASCTAGWLSGSAIPKSFKTSRVLAFPEPLGNPVENLRVSPSLSAAPNSVSSLTANGHTKDTGSERGKRKSSSGAARGELGRIPELQARLQSWSRSRESGARIRVSSIPARPRSPSPDPDCPDRNRQRNRKPPDRKKRTEARVHAGDLAGKTGRSV